MITTYVILSILVIVSAISKAIMDTINFHHDASVFKNAGDWFNPLNSWKNKYNWFPNSKVLTWLISNPFVFITDAWHFFGMIQRMAIFSCLFFSPIWWSIPILYLLFTLVFSLFFIYIFVKK